MLLSQAGLVQQTAIKHGTRASFRMARILSVLYRFFDFERSGSWTSLLNKKGKKMSTALPYVTATGNVDRALTNIKSAATPPNVTQDFVKTILKISGGSGNQMTSYLKKIGFANADGTPTVLYTKFRNPATASSAALEALKIGYKPLFVRNEYMDKLSDEKVRGLIIEETGQSDDSNVVGLILACIKGIKKHIKPDEVGTAKSPTGEEVAMPKLPTIPKDPSFAESPAGGTGVGLNLSYTINLNLPATTDVAVFNAIFKSLKENLLKATNE
jgi:hypothetical protein